MGFIISGLCWLILAAEYDNLTNNVAGFIVIYITAQFFLNFGPNTTTFVIPGEAFPTKFRATCHGIAAASGKAGAILAAHGFSILKDTWGIPTLLYVFSGFMFLGLLTTFMIPETKGKTLEELENQFIFTANAKLEKTRDKPQINSENHKNELKIICIKEIINTKFARDELNQKSLNSSSDIQEKKTDIHFPEGIKDIYTIKCFDGIQEKNFHMISSDGINK